MANNHKYKLRYKIERKPEGFTVDEAKAMSKEGYGACDAVLLASIIFPEDGSYSLFFIGEDGRTDTELSDHEWFKVWSMLAKRLGQSKTLDPGRREFANATFHAFLAMMKFPPKEN